MEYIEKGVKILKGATHGIFIPMVVWFLMVGEGYSFAQVADASVLWIVVAAAVYHARMVEAIHDPFGDANAPAEMAFYATAILWMAWLLATATLGEAAL